MSLIKNIFGKINYLQTAPPLTPPVAEDKPVVAVVEEPPYPLSPEETIAFVQSFPFWYHRIYLGHGIYTWAGAAHHEGVWQRLEPTLTQGLQGASVLDIASNAGYFSMQLKRAGAGKVVGLERKEDYLKQAEVCRQIWGLDIEYRAADVEDLDPIQEEFELVIFAGILYHLKNPLRTLETLGRVCRDAIVIETEIISEDPRNCVYVRQGPQGQVKVTPCRTGIMKFIEADELNSDGSNWWVPDTECVIGMLRTSGFKYFSAPCYLQENRLLLIATKNRESILDPQTLK